MADIKKVLEIEVDAKTGEIKVLNQEIEKTNKGVKKAEKGTSGMAKAWRKVGTALKAAGIGLLVAGLAKLTELFSRNQAVVDGFTTSMNVLSIAFNDFFSFISDNISTVTDYFKDLFENPGDKLREIADTIKNYVITNVQLLIKGFGTLGETMGFLFDGEFSKALETAKKGAAEVGEALIKLNPATAVVANLAEKVYDNRDAIVEYTKSTLDQAQALTNAAAATQFLEVESRRLQLQYQKQAEELRQIRDDERNSIQERIEANRQLGELLVESAKVEKETVQQRINNLEREQEILGYNRDRQVEIENLKVEQLDIDERIAGFRSEQLMNENSLLREQTDLIREQDALRIELMEDGIDKELMASAAKYDELYRQAEGNKELQLAITEAQEREAARIQEDYRQKELEAKRAAAEEEKRLEKEKLDAVRQENMAKQQVISGTAQLSTQLLQEVASMTGEEGKRAFQIQKAANLATAVTNTALAVTGALTAGGNPLKLATGAQFVEAALVGSWGAVQIAKIASTQYKGGGGGASSGGAAGGGGGQGAPAVNFNTVGGSGINQLNESIVAQNNTVKAYVVSSEVSSAQSLDRNRQSNATFG